MFYESGGKRGEGKETGLLISISLLLFVKKQGETKYKLKYFKCQVIGQSRNDANLYELGKGIIVCRGKKQWRESLYKNFLK